MNRAIRTNRADAAVETVLRKREQDRQWEIYLALCSMPFSDPGTFEEFSERQQRANAPARARQQEPLSQKQLKKQVAAAERLLQGFTPPEANGGEK